MSVFACFYVFPFICSHYLSLSIKVFVYLYSLASLKDAQYREDGQTKTDLVFWELAPCYSTWQWL